MDGWNRRGWRGWLGVAVLGASLARPAYGQAGAAAEALFQEGSAAAEAGDFALACSKFEGSQKLDPTAGTLLNLADCKEHLGQLATAWQFYLEAAAKFAPGDERTAYAEQHAAALAPRLPKVQLTFVSPPEGVRITRGAEPIPLAALDTSLPVDPGQHTYRVECPGYEPATFAVTAQEGEEQTLPLSVGAAVSAAVAAPATASPPAEEPEPYLEPAPKESSSVKKPLGWASLGLGAVGLVVGTVTGIIVIDKKNLVDQDCLNDYCRTDAGTSAASDGATLSIVSTVSFAVGGLATAGGLYLLLSGPKEKPTAILRATPSALGGMLHLEGTL